MVSSDYAVKVINLLFPDDINTVRQERFWQIEHLKNIEVYTSLWVIFIRILPIRAEVCFAPSHHGLQNRDEALAEFGKRIFHLRWDFLVNLPM